MYGGVRVGVLNSLYLTDKYKAKLFSKKHSFKGVAFNYIKCINNGEPRAR